MKQFAINLLKAVGKYLALVVVGTYLFLIFSPVIGYLPYSDRPGPGWHGKPFDITWSGFLENVFLMNGFALFLSMYAIVVAALLFSGTRLLEKLKIPKLGITIIGTVLSSFLSAYIVAAVGWYMAIGDAAVIVASLLGMIFGIFVLPRKNTCLTSHSSEPLTRPLNSNAR